MSEEKGKPSVIQTGFDAKIVDQGKETNAKEDIISRMNEAELEQKPTSKPILIECDFPDKVKLGENYTIKYNKEFLKIEMKVYQGAKVTEISGNDNCVYDGEEKNAREITFEFFDPNRLKGKVVNGLTPGEYLVKVHAYGYNTRDEHNEEKIVEAS